MRFFAAEPPPYPIPRIPPVPPGAERPLISVMIPTFRSNDLLEKTLRGVLDQDPGPDRMQIAIVDDRSPGDNHLQVVRRLAPSRVEVHTQPANVGLARNWNGAIERSRGHWVHILHQDDLVLPGFYERLARVDDGATGVGAAFCRHLFIDGEGRGTDVSSLERPTAGVLERWLEKISRSQYIQCPSIIVRRHVYEHLGGFRTDLCYALDWEMWVRIASHYRYWFEPEALACYRVHEGNETARLKRVGRDLSDIRRAIRILSAGVPSEIEENLGRDLLAWIRDHELREMIERFSERKLRFGLAHLLRAHSCDPTMNFAGIFFRSYAKWSLKVLLLGPGQPGRLADEPRDGAVVGEVHASPCTPKS
jgi:glycosyltransferase involved in cell wall biosynthesis